MSEAREKLVKFCLEKYPGTTKAHAEKIADQILKEERQKIRKELSGEGDNSVKSRIKRKAGLK